MVAGHMFIINQGKWFILGHEKYGIHTRWVSDFAAVSPEGWFIKGSIILFCIAWFLFMHPKFRSSSGNARGCFMHFWKVMLTFGVIGGLLLVVFFDVSPPQFIRNEPSWLERIFGKDTIVVQRPLSEIEYIKQWHHKLGFQIFIFSFAATLLSSVLEKLCFKNTHGRLCDGLFLLFTTLFMWWLFEVHNSVAGIPQRALLVLIFCWVWQKVWNSGKNRNPGFHFTEAFSAARTTST